MTNQYAYPNDVVASSTGEYAEPESVIADAPAEFKLGRWVNENIPKPLKVPARILGEATRVGQLPLLALDAVIGSNTSGQYDTFLEAAFGKSNPIEKLIAAGSGGLGTGLMSKAIGPLRGTIAGGLGYLGGEVGGQSGKAAGTVLAELTGADKERYGTFGQAGGALVGSILGGSPTLLPGNTTAAQMAREALKGYTPKQIQEAIGAQREAARLGINLRPGQALTGGSPGLTALEQEVVSTPIGKGQLESRILSVPEAARESARTTSRAFGPYDESFMRTNEIRQAIARAVESPAKVARAVSKDLYDEAENLKFSLPTDERFAIIDRLKTIEDDLRVLPRSEGGKAIGKVQRAAAKESMILDPATGKPFNLAEADTIKLSHYLDELNNQIKAGMSAAATPEQKSRMRAYTAAVDEIKARIHDANPALRGADYVYGSAMRDLANRNQATNLGGTISRTEMKPGPLTPAATWGQFRKIITDGTPDDVSRAALSLRAHDRNAVRDIALQWIDSVYKDAFPAGQLGNPAKFSGELLANKNLDRVVQIAALESGGRDPKAASDGFRAALSAIQLAGNPTAVPGKAADLAQIMSLNPSTTLGRLAVGNQLSRTNLIVGRIKYEASKRQYKKLYEAFNDPDSLAKLEELGRTSVMTPRFASLLSSIVGGSVAIDQ